MNGVIRGVPPHDYAFRRAIEIRNNSNGENLTLQDVESFRFSKSLLWGESWNTTVTSTPEGYKCIVNNPEGKVEGDPQVLEREIEVICKQSNFQFLSIRLQSKCAYSKV